MKRKLLSTILIFSLSLFFSNLIAQEIEVSGQVISATDNMPLMGASVIIKGTNRGVATDFEGRYSIKANQGETLEFISLGFTTFEKKVIDVGGGVNHSLSMFY